jgi:uncharacterized protein YbjQ (UPF0145 family)
MVKKDDDDDNRHDFTSIGDMTAFHHPDDLEAELKFKEINTVQLETKIETLTEEEGDAEEVVEVQAFDSAEDSSPPEIPLDDLPDIDFGEPVAAEEIEVNTEANFDHSTLEDITIDVAEDSVFSDEITEAIPEEIQNDFAEEQITYTKPETFNEVQSFGQNFSIGELPSGGNPPFSLLIKNIQFEEDADSILGLLREYKIVNNENENEFARSMEYGNLLIPQINEYLAIILTHKLRRFACDLEMGLSDQIQPSRSGDSNPRGLINKTHLAQNKKENFNVTKDQIPLSEIIATTTSGLIGYRISQYKGVETAFRMLENADLERLHFVQDRLNQDLQQLDDDTKSDYADFTSNFHQLYSDLLNEIKERAFLKSANAVLGVNFSLTPFLAAHNHSQNKYQLTCSATLAFVIKENLQDTNEAL